MNPVLVSAVVVYVLFLLFYVLWSVFLLYHLLRFTPRRIVALSAVAVFVGVTAFLLLVSFASLARINWSAPLILPFSGFGF